MRDSRHHFQRERERSNRKAPTQWVRLFATRSVRLFTASLVTLSCSLAASDAAAQPKTTDEREAFSQHVLQIASQEFPNLNLKKTEQPLQCTWINGNHLSLDNLYKTIRQDTEPGKEDDEIRRFLKSITELSSDAAAKNALPWDDAKSKLRPQIVPSTKVENASTRSVPAQNSVTSQIFGAKPTKKKVIVHRPLPFSNKLFEGFVIDSENTFQYLYQENLQKWNVNLDVVSKCAYENLSKNSQNLKLELHDEGSKGKYITISVTDGYAAARILLPEIRKRLQKDLGDRCFVGIPNRDYLIAWSSDAPHQERFAEQVRKSYRSRHHPLTPQVYQLDDNSLSNAVIIGSEVEDTPRPRRKRRPRIIRRKPDPSISAPAATPGATPAAAPESAPVSPSVPSGEPSADSM